MAKRRAGTICATLGSHGALCNYAFRRAKYRRLFRLLAGRREFLGTAEDQKVAQRSSEKLLLGAYQVQQQENVGASRHDCIECHLGRRPGDLSSRSGNLCDCRVCVATSLPGGKWHIPNFADAADATATLLKRGRSVGSGAKLSGIRGTQLESPSKEFRSIGKVAHVPLSRCLTLSPSMTPAVGAAPFPPVSSCDYG